MMGHARLSTPSNRVAQAQTSPIVRPCPMRNPATPAATREPSQSENQSQANQAPAATTRLPSRALSWGLHHVLIMRELFSLNDARTSLSSDSAVVNGDACGREGGQDKANKTLNKSISVIFASLRSPTLNVM